MSDHPEKITTMFKLVEPRHEKTGFLLIRKQTSRSAVQCLSDCTADQRLCFRYSDSTIPLFLKFQISSF